VFSRDEYRKLKKDLIYIMSCKVTYDLVKKSKIGQAINLLAEKIKHHKDDKNIDDLQNRVVDAKHKLKDFIRN
jgi:hypothetical protein